ncbi:hypothetical protein POM88_040905 [Heracleum sosnowskyi]|uniref:Retrotransposon gag domain-containing protein n=1 Tax=Heracleum sosnowskyi TaxID=360622 RepID=A0AAD8MA72_9APIA|nr:hypothetical protein POM88_040905 [Heracleum sosnowskyi]
MARTRKTATATESTVTTTVPTTTEPGSLPLTTVVSQPLGTLPITTEVVSQPQGTNPQASIPQNETNPLQMVVSPLDHNLPHGAQIFTTVLPISTNPAYGLPNYPPETGGSGHAPIIHEPYEPPYIRGLGPVPEGRYLDYSGPYSDDYSSDEGRDRAPRRRRASKEPFGRRNRGATTRVPMTAMERIRAHEAEIQKLKKNIEIEQQRRQTQPSNQGAGDVPIIDLGTPSRRQEGARAPRTEIPKSDPRVLTQLGDPDDPIPPFTEEVMDAHVSRKFKMPTIKAYDGTGDPATHVRTFSNALLLQPVTDALKCRAFPQTLAGMAQRWYSRLPPNSISCFKDLSTAFINQFISGRVHEKSSASLMNLIQGKNETLRDYLKRFTKETLNIPDLDNKVAMIALQQGTTDVFFKMSLAKHPPESMTELQQRVGKYIKAEESMKKTDTGGGNNGGSNKRKTEQEYDVKDKYPRTTRDSDSDTKFTEYARLNAPRSQILFDIEKDRDFRWPKPLRGDPEKRNKNKYCRYHKDSGHDTDDCRQLKDEIEFLIRKGKLDKFTKDGNRGNQHGNYERKNYDTRDDDQDHNPKPRGPVINMIYGGPAATLRPNRVGGQVLPIEVMDSRDDEEIRD